jgi:hypothetical protein
MSSSSVGVIGAVTAVCLLMILAVTLMRRRMNALEAGAYTRPLLSST